MAKLYFYYSAMNAGKTTTLLQSAHNYRERGMRVAILSPRLDDRAGSGKVASRIGLSAEATGFDHDADLLDWTNADIAAHGRLDCLLVDEAQFLRKPQVRSEEHTSELQSLMRISYAVFCLIQKTRHTSCAAAQQSNRYK